MEYREFCEALAKDASAVIMDAFVKEKQVEYKEHDSIVTATDQYINALVIKRIQEKYPDHDIIGEEDSYLENKSEYCWICDPIDGTIPFSLGIPTMAFSLALTKNGRPIAAVAIHPPSNLMCYAELHKGTWIGDQQQHVGSTHRTRHVGFTEWATAAHRTPGAFDGLVELGFNPLDIGSVVFMGMLVACGQMDGVVFTGDMTHDTPAYDLLVTEAGGRVTDFAGEPIDYRQPIYGCIATNGDIHDSILDLLAD